MMKEARISSKASRTSSSKRAKSTVSPKVLQYRCKSSRSRLRRSSGATESARK
eukprot:CAMPEP_0179166370 /NCGR_PEP_ID=MMETSP0796-20121207/81737_1 /TAXON_ID=73915 /ORGANISM="Pyrodinium bahamense, Strain pbaha01" /LENGTH=52 /DNA_ID=CAMNT_0020868963 /DNA_START=129 /DNA_END=287 /DNA_ORIENTATION=+